MSAEIRSSTAISLQVEIHEPEFKLQQSTMKITLLTFNAISLNVQERKFCLTTCTLSQVCICQSNLTIHISHLTLLYGKCTRQWNGWAV